ncbi:hypothetical protein [Marinobacter qingdaonensis]|uniref:DUF2382 domain-containing protein n=1 Tax=Marinobacter qingdaonensis TaxID=3108486 RepID=A0ABU5NUQ8_9GAMM|nr:hypothetical protein [Marinobacter sp. ASW11-75]MEA1079539.1 hypothetical protein [Marinobacter sp. ASW11-75]
MSNLKKKNAVQVAPISVLSEGKMACDGIKMIQIERTVVAGELMVSARLEGKLVIRHEDVEYLVVVPLEVSKIQGEDLRDMKIEHSDFARIKTPGSVFEEETGEKASAETVSDEIYLGRGDEVISLVKVHEEWEVLEMWLRSEFRSRLS